VPQERLPFQDGGELLEQGIADDEGAGAAVAEHVIDVRGGEKRVDRYRNQAGLDGAPEARHEIRRIEQEEQHPLLHLDAQGEQRVAGAVRPLAELAPGHRPSRFADRDAVGMAEIALEQVYRRIVGRAHGANPIAGRAPSKDAA